MYTMKQGVQQGRSLVRFVLKSAEIKPMLKSGITPESLLLTRSQSLSPLENKSIHSFVSRRTQTLVLRPNPWHKLRVEFGR